MIFLFCGKSQEWFPLGVYRYDLPAAWKLVVYFSLLVPSPLSFPDLITRHSSMWGPFLFPSQLRFCKNQCGRPLLDAFWTPAWPLTEQSQFIDWFRKLKEIYKTDVLLHKNCFDSSSVYYICRCVILFVIKNVSFPVTGIRSFFFLWSPLETFKKLLLC